MSGHDNILTPSTRTPMPTSASRSSSSKAPSSSKALTSASASASRCARRAPAALPDCLWRREVLTCRSLRRPSIGSVSTTHRKSRSALRARSLSVCVGHACRVAHKRPLGIGQIARGNEGHCALPHAVFRLPLPALPKESSANKESHLTRPTQELLGAALSYPNQIGTMSS